MRHRVLIAGSGVAAVEAVLALRHLAGRHFEIHTHSFGRERPAAFRRSPQR